MNIFATYPVDNYNSQRFFKRHDTTFFLGDLLSPEFPVQSFVLQYQGKRLSMVVLLPAPNVKIDDILAKVISELYCSQPRYF